ncbi:hypothetical protein D9Q98_005694 [Chlorella vulgaris]|uniref:Uncharacterized protein n=1 Tax=Chlorella vulgaris TaxID=3077 RepID=A0A9D4YW76_CHLVU|nr:hypothetical protein D9Q98_005694 [Chlorella vulgaris]
MGVVAQFMAFGGGLVVAAVALKSMDRVLYNLDETREERGKENLLRKQARLRQQSLLAEATAAAAAASPST